MLGKLMQMSIFIISSHLASLVYTIKICNITSLLTEGKIIGKSTFNGKRNGPLIGFKTIKWPLEASACSRYVDQNWGKTVTKA